MRELTFSDKLLLQIDVTLRTLVPPKERISQRPFPAESIHHDTLSASQKKHVAGLMRVNHAGEVSAQALYQGQALTAQLASIKKQMREAAEEENDHLAWCEQRLNELDSRPSYLNPIWYMGSLMLGAMAGLVSDAFSLGFVVETERQVGAHLQSHLSNLPQEDTRTKAILEQMEIDESHHAEVAIKAGAVELPPFIKKLMAITAKIMTRSSYYF
jgi:ubiquinone biosynthesis monooxygenase Coq7